MRRTVQFVTGSAAALWTSLLSTVCPPDRWVPLACMGSGHLPKRIPSFGFLANRRRTVDGDLRYFSSYSISVAIGSQRTVTSCDTSLESMNMRSCALLETSDGA